MTTDERGWNKLEERIAAIVAGGRAVRESVADAVAAALAGGRTAFRSVSDVIGSVARGAIQGARQAASASPRGVLEAVVDGAGDGLVRSGLAARLAFEEAQKRGQAFARRDLEQLVDELGAAGKMFADAFGHAAADAGDELGSQWDAVREHAQRTRVQIEPGLRAAVDAVRADPLGLAADTAGAGAGAARRAAGELFGAVGGMLSEAAKRLKGG